MFRLPVLLLLAALFLSVFSARAQKDSASAKKPLKNTSIFGKSDPKKAYNPRIATYRSAILPGWGQFTNKKYWKIPIVYAALGITAGIFIYDIRQFNDVKAALKNAEDGDPTNDYLIPEPYFSVKDDPNRLRNFRNEVRQNVDYAGIFILVFWALNVVDATVDAHLKTFDVSDDIGLQLRPGYSPMAKTNGISLVMNFGRKHSR